MLAPPTAGHFPNSPYFAIPLVSLIQPLTTFLEEKKSFNLQFDFMLTLQHKQQRALLFAWKLHKELHPSAVKNQTLDQRTLHPWNSTGLQATSNAYQLIALCLCNKRMPNLTVRYGSPVKKVAGLMGAGLLPPWSIFFFQVFPLISIWQSSCSVPARNWPFL